MAAGDTHKVLRIGVIQGGKIVEERVLPARQPATVGSGSRNTIAVAKSELLESTSSGVDNLLLSGRNSGAGASVTGV